MQAMKLVQCAILTTLAVGLLLGCGEGDGKPAGKWFLYTCYEVRVVCFTL